MSVPNCSKSISDYYRKGKQNNLNFIRFLAAAGVLLSHSYPLSGHSTDEPFALFSIGQLDLGNICVGIFFIISGFLIFQSYEKAPNVGHYFKARSLRIFPALAVVLVITTFMLGPVVSILSINDYFKNSVTYEYLRSIFLYPIRWNLPGVFTRNAYANTVNGSLWTIPFEFICYCLIGILGQWRFLKSKHYVGALFAVSCYLFVYGKLIIGDAHVLGLSMIDLLSLWIYFAAGMVYYAYRDNIILNKLWAMFILMFFLVASKYGGLNSLLIIFGGYLIFYFAFVPKISFLRFFQKRDFSYGLYLYAFPIQQTVTLFFGGRMNPIKNSLISFPFAMLFAALSWYLIEKRFLSLKNVSFLTSINRVKTFELLSDKVHMVRRFIDDFLNMLLCKIKLNWIIFFIFFIVFGIAIESYTSLPSDIQFPYHKSDQIFHGNWLPQGEGENYKWISGEGSVYMLQPQGTSKLNITGYVPSTFINIKKVVVYVDNNELKVFNLKPGEQFQISVDMPKALENKKVDVKLSFDNIHKPDLGDPDQRSLSAFISELKFVP